MYEKYDDDLLANAKDAALSGFYKVLYDEEMGCDAIIIGRVTSIDDGCTSADAEIEWSVPIDREWIGEAIENLEESVNNTVDNVLGTSM